MTHKTFRRWSKTINITVSILIPFTIIYGIFYEFFYSLEDDLADGMFNFFILVLLLNGGITVGTFIYMLVKSKADLLSRLLWMGINEFFLFIAVVISIITALSG